MAARSYRSKRIPFWWHLAVVLWVWHSGYATAEYRVYQLLITDSKTQQTRIVTSTLDHIQYPGYYQLGADETIVLGNTWMCWGRQGNFQPLCANPKTPPLAKIDKPGP